MKSLQKYLPIALFSAFLLFGLSAFIESKPTPKQSRIYTFVSSYSPYYLEKRFGGLEIRSKEDSAFKLKPSNQALFHTFERLEKQWGKEHLRIQDKTLELYDNQHHLKATLPLKTEEELTFLHNYYEV